MTKRLIPFAGIYAQAVANKGSEKALKALLPAGIKSARQLANTGDDRYLSAITRSVFKAGFVWRVIENKWPDFEEAFQHFDVETCRHFSAEDEDRLCQDQRIVRNRQKILTVRQNANMIADIAAQHRSFGRFIGKWPDDDYIGLLDYFKRHGARMGGNSCQYFLRAIGKDGFLLTDDVGRALIDAGVIDKGPTSKLERQKVQAAFNQWRIESGLNFAAMSRTLAISVG